VEIRNMSPSYFMCRCQPGLRKKPDFWLYGAVQISAGRQARARSTSSPGDPAAVWRSTELAAQLACGQTRVSAVSACADRQADRSSARPGVGVAIDLRSGTFGICKQEQQDPKALSEVTDEK
jgi:uncharacterized metal-binding protein